MPPIGLLPDIFVPAFEMSVNSRPLDPLMTKSVMEVTITEHLKPPNEFNFRVNDPKLKLIARQNGLFTEGARIELSIGYVGNTRNLVVGEISALTADFPSNGPAAVTVEGFDLLHRLTRGTVYRRWEGSAQNSALPDGDIAARIAKEAGLGFSGEPTATRTQVRVQNYQTNLHFLESLAEENGFFLWMDGETLCFKSRPPTRPSIALEWGKSLMSFSPRLTTAGQTETIEVRGWDPVQKQRISSRVQRPSAAAAKVSPSGQEQIGKGAGGLSALVITERNVSSVQEAQAMAQKLLSGSMQQFITGHGTSVGIPDLRVGSLLELRGIARFSDVYRVTEVTHTVGDAGYQTSFEVKGKELP